MLISWTFFEEQIRKRKTGLVESENAELTNVWSPRYNQQHKPLLWIAPRLKIQKITRKRKLIYRKLWTWWSLCIWEGSHEIFNKNSNKWFAVEKEKNAKGERVWKIWRKWKEVREWKDYRKKYREVCKGKEVINEKHIRKRKLWNENYKWSRNEMKSLWVKENDRMRSL